MDRSFLSIDRVVEASRQFVCVRLATYEDKQEAEFLKSLFRTRSGELENTVFALLSPDGRTRLARAGRGPHAFRSASGLASEMNRIADSYLKTAKPLWSNTSLPYMKSVELALNVAACDRLPVVVVVAASAADRDRLETRLSSVAWSEQFGGKFVYATAAKKSDLKPITKSVFDPSILLVQPGVFGLTAEILHQIPLADIQSKAKPAAISAAFQDVAADFQPQFMDYRSHIDLGISLDIDWKTKIPVTDRQSIQAKQRARGQ